MKRSKLEMHNLALCADAAFLGTARTILHQLQVTPEVVYIRTGADALQQWLTACVERSVSRICERIREACA